MYNFHDIIKNMEHVARATIVARLMHVVRSMHVVVNIVSLSNQSCPPFNTQHTMHGTNNHNRKVAKSTIPTSQWINKSRSFTFTWHIKWHHFIICIVDLISFHHQNQIGSLPTSLRKMWFCTFCMTVITHFVLIYCSRWMSFLWCEKERRCLIYILVSNNGT